jgi:predicted nucleic acid-binding protein
VTFLLDVNVLIALIDPTHVGRDAAHRWFRTTGAASWATCPLTENGVIRIVGHPKYPNTVGSPAAVAPIVLGLRALSGHIFWRDDLSLVGSDLVDAKQNDHTRSGHRYLSPGPRRRQKGPISDL